MSFWKSVGNFFKTIFKPSKRKPATILEPPRQRETIKPKTPFIVTKREHYDEYDDYDFGFDFDGGESEVY